MEVIKIIIFSLIGILTLVSIYIIVIILIFSRKKYIDAYPDPTDDYSDTEIEEWLTRGKKY